MKKFLVLLVLAYGIACTSITLDGTLHTPVVMAGERGEYITIAPITPGRAAFDTYYAHAEPPSPSWPDIPFETQRRWEQTTQAALKADAALREYYANEKYECHGEGGE